MPAEMEPVMEYLDDPETMYSLGSGLGFATRFLERGLFSDRMDGDEPVYSWNDAGEAYNMVERGSVATAASYVADRLDTGSGYLEDDIGFGAGFVSGQVAADAVVAGARSWYDQIKGDQ